MGFGKGTGRMLGKRIRVGIGRRTKERIRRGIGIGRRIRERVRRGIRIGRGNGIGIKDLVWSGEGGKVCRVVREVGR